MPGLSIITICGNSKFTVDMAANSFFTRRKIRRDLRAILKEHGFKQQFLRHPFSEVYRTGGDVEAMIYSEPFREDMGSIEQGIPPCRYGAVGLSMVGREKDPIFTKVAEKLKTYYGIFEEPILGELK